jgi:hypothetical protein
MKGDLREPPEQRMLIDLARDYLNVPVPEHRAVIASLARALAEENAKIRKSQTRRGQARYEQAQRVSGAQRLLGILLH